MKKGVNPVNLLTEVRMPQMTEGSSSTDGEWSLPWGRKLVHALLVLDEAQHQVAFLEGASFHPPAVVAAESLLVDGGARAS